MAVPANGRDLIFEFDHSCNCCKKSIQKMKPDSPVYLMQDGRVKKFDFKKAENVIVAAKAALANLNHYLAILCPNFLYHGLILERLKEKGIDITEKDNPPILTIQQIHLIDEIVKEVLNGPLPERKHTNSPELD